MFNRTMFIDVFYRYTLKYNGTFRRLYSVKFGNVGMFKFAEILINKNIESRLYISCSLIFPHFAYTISVRKEISMVRHKFSFAQPLRTHGSGDHGTRRRYSLGGLSTSAIISGKLLGRPFRIANCSVFFTRTIKVIKGRSADAKVSPLSYRELELIARPNRSLNRTPTVIKLIPRTFCTHREDWPFSALAVLTSSFFPSRNFLPWKINRDFNTLDTI